MDSDLELLFPESYIESTRERVRLYRELDEIPDPEALESFARQLVDRFGEMPEQTRELLLVVRLRWLAMDLGIERIQLKNDRMVLYFISDPDSDYYRSPVFSAVLDYVQQNPGRCQMKESINKLTLSFGNIRSVSQAVEILEGMGV